MGNRILKEYHKTKLALGRGVSVKGGKETLFKKFTFKFNYQVYEWQKVAIYSCYFKTFRKCCSEKF